MTNPSPQLQAAPLIGKIIDSQAFRDALESGQDPLPLFRRMINSGNAKLIELFESGHQIEELIRIRADFMDILLKQAWHLKVRSESNVALIAVGGYGRGELHPASDLDLLILLGTEKDDRLSEELSDLLTFFWDIGLDVGHSVRNMEECIQVAEGDISIATNLVESRLLAGPENLYKVLKDTTGPDCIWPSDRFFQAKWEEQKSRYLKYDETVSSLEPNIKESPGGLRDIQMVGWVAKRHFGAETMHDLVSEGFLTEEEYLDLMDGQSFLWKVRFALHIETGRHEDRILFDYQRLLASRFGFQDDEQGLGVENFMQQYYKTALKISRMNEMLLQLFHEVILLKCHLEEPRPINKRFQSRSGFLETVDERVFLRNPMALLELFLVMGQHPELNGVRASTIRQARKYRYLINDSFRSDLRARSLFMEILRQKHGVSHELRRMNRYGILARYIPAFANIVGRMQYDLFHVYTVDEHTLLVLRNLRRLTVDIYRSEFPLCSDIMDRIPKQEILYLSALFHDIAKGRGGDHSKLGAADAREFCKLHGLSDYDGRLVSWLVEHHLLMSITAQRRDISDPEVIHAFAVKVNNTVRLDYLYLLTIADIRATDPKKWNSWKNSLLRELYMATKHALMRGLQNPQEQDEIIQNKQAGALHLLKSDGFDEQQALVHWRNLSLDYFLYHNWEEVAWQTKMVITAKSENMPLVLVRKSNIRGGTEVFIYTADRRGLFATMTSLLDQLGLNIVSARIETADTGYTLNSFLVLNEQGEPIEQPHRKDEIRMTLQQALRSSEEQELVVSRHVPRQLKHFSTPTRIDFIDDRSNRRTIMKLLADDRPGLLSQVGYAFAACRIRLIAAKISTIGAEAEDTFFITNFDNLAIKDKQQLRCLEHAIMERLGSH